VTGLEHGSQVFVLSRGEYSDYRVLCVCPDKVQAEQLAARYNADKSGYHSDVVEVEELWVFGGETQKLETLLLQTELFDNGNENAKDPMYTAVWPFDDWSGAATTPVQWRWVRAPMYHDKGGRLEVRGYDHERVRKVFSDRRAAILADETGLLRKTTSAQGVGGGSPVVPSAVYPVKPARCMSMWNHHWCMLTHEHQGPHVGDSGKASWPDGYATGLATSEMLGLPEVACIEVNQAAGRCGVVSEVEGSTVICWRPISHKGPHEHETGDRVVKWVTK
jgi:hypothetical protein